MSSLLVQHKSILSHHCKIDESGAITYRNESFQAAFLHIEPVRFDQLFNDSDESERFNEALTDANDSNPNPSICNVQILNNSGVFQLWVFEVFKLNDGYHIAGMPVYDAISVQSVEYIQTRERLNNLIWVLSHKFRQPMTEIGGLINIMSTVDPASDPEQYGKLASMLVKPWQKVDQLLRELIAKN